MLLEKTQFGCIRK